MIIIVIKARIQNMKLISSLKIIEKHEKNKIIIIFAAFLGVMMTMTGVASAELAGNCPAYNGVGSAAPAISPKLLAYTETGALIRTISVVTSNQTPTTGNDIIPGVLMICNYPIVGSVAGTSKVTLIKPMYIGPKGLWAGGKGCGKDDCVRIGRTNGNGNKNNMPMNGSTFIAGNVTFSTQPLSELIVAHINWPAICGSSGTCFRTLSPALPALKLTKTASPATYNSVGQKITYNYVINNTGNIVLSGKFSVFDNKTTVTCPGTPTSLNPGVSINCSASYNVTQADLNAGSITNIATGTAANNGNPITSNQAQATVSAIQTKTLKLSKIASPMTYNFVGQNITYNYVINNTGNVELSGKFSVFDNKTTVTCPDTPKSLSPGVSITCSTSYSVTQADFFAHSIINIATAEAYNDGNPVTSNADLATIQQSGPVPPVPELPTIALMGIGILGLLFISRTKK